MDEKQGRKNKASGQKFESLVRADLEHQGFIVSKWSNIVENGKIISKRPKYNPFAKKIMMASGGFPDFIAFKRIEGYEGSPEFKVIGVEAKKGKYLQKNQKEMAQFYLEKKTFSQLLVAYKKRGDSTVYYEEL